MKKKTMVLLTWVLTFGAFVSGCAADNKTNSSTGSSTGESSSADVASGASEQVYTDLSELKEDYDVIIVGAGGAGMTAALEAKEQGMNPVIFEKMPVAGGNTMKSSSGMNASETKFQKEEGISDSNDAFFEETLKGGHGTNDQELLRYYVDNSASAIDWLDSIGIKLSNLTITGGMSEKRTHRPEDGSAIGGYLVEGLFQNVKEKEIPLFVNADVTKLIEKDGAVTGVSVTFNEKTTKEITSKAVIVTTGGYGANNELIQEYRPELKGYVTTNQSGSTGDGIKMIEEVGGATVDMDQIQIHPTVQQDKGILIGEVVRGEGGILVSQEGTRFVNELDTRDKVSSAIDALPERAAYLIFDAGVKERATAIKFYEEQGYVIEAKSIDALAKELDMPADQLSKTIETWNGSVHEQKDAAFDRSTGMDNDLSNAPYYAIKIAPGIHYTMGGVKINTDTQVLNDKGEAITGLYAAGEVTGGLHGENRIGGNSVGEIIVFGRQAGVQAAAFAKK